MKKIVVITALAIAGLTFNTVAQGPGGPGPGPGGPGPGRGPGPGPARGPRQNDNAFPDISIADVKAAIAAKTITLLDANGTPSWKQGHVPGAIDFAANETALARVLPADKKALIVAYCGGPRCHAYAAAAQAAKALGYTNVKHMSAGIQGWMAANEATQKGN